MKKYVSKDKYCLYGEYFDAYEKINIKLMWRIPRNFKKIVCEDSLEMLYRNQECNKSVQKALGCSIDEFVDNIINSYYSTCKKRKIMEFLLKNSILISLVSLLFAILDTNFIINIYVLVWTLLGFLIGLIWNVIAFNSKKKIQIMWGLDIVIFLNLIFHKLIYKVIPNIKLPNIFGISIVLALILIYIILVEISNKREKGEDYGK